MDGDSDGCQVEVVEQHRQMVMEPSGGGKLELQVPTRHTRHGAVLVRAERLVCEPQLH